MAKKRLDIYIHETFELDSRQLAQNYIIQGFIKPIFPKAEMPYPKCRLSMKIVYL